MEKIKHEIKNLSGFAEWKNKKIIKLKDVTLYVIPIRYFSERSDFDSEDLCVTGIVIEGNTIASEIFTISKKGIIPPFHSFCADKIILENDKMKFIISDVDFTTPFENGCISNIEFHGTIGSIEFKQEKIKKEI